MANLGKTCCIVIALDLPSFGKVQHHIAQSKYYCLPVVLHVVVCGSGTRLLGAANMATYLIQGGWDGVLDGKVWSVTDESGRHITLHAKYN